MVCSTFTSDAPGTFCNAAAICSPVWFSTAMSSPKIFTATSLRTPEISSLKRSWIGCENSYALPGSSASASSISRTSWSRGFFGSGHRSAGFSMM